MHLSQKNIITYTEAIKKLCHVTPIVHSNKTFDVINLKKDEAETIKDILSEALFVRYTHISKVPNSDTYSVQGNLVEKLDQLEEDIQIHDTLNPKIWNSDNELLPEVEDKIYEIVDIFKTQLAEDGVDLHVADIYILGSNANYNYTENSDLDIHIIADESDDCNKNHLDIIYNAYKRIFNDKYDIKFHGINVEIYVENKDDISKASSGIYSMTSGWIKSPSVYKIPKIDTAAFEKLVAKWENRYLDIEDNPTIENIEKYIDDIYALRASGIKENGDFGLGNLVFKEIRNLGYLENLKDMKINLQNEYLSV